jgi:hypothetical protein
LSEAFIIETSLWVGAMATLREVAHEVSCAGSVKGGMAGAHGKNHAIAETGGFEANDVDWASGAWEEW